ncbi:hypothetical protein [Salinicola tamaricis]|uniref:hypothetical protein n=1 Tax=Salinicola tamaricis TaxID=1771309 RepID=UPI003BF475E4
MPRLAGARAQGSEVIGDAAVDACWQLGDGSTLAPSIWAGRGEPRRLGAVAGHFARRRGRGAGRGLAAAARCAVRCGWMPGRPRHERARHRRHVTAYAGRGGWADSRVGGQRRQPLYARGRASA